MLIGKKISGEKRGVAKKRGGCGEKVKNSGEKVKHNGRKNLIHAHAGHVEGQDGVAKDRVHVAHEHG
jgi:hypothetical protein